VSSQSHKEANAKIIKIGRQDQQYHLPVNQNHSNTVIRSHAQYEATALAP